jgi:dihydroxyacetone kinase
VLLSGDRLHFGLAAEQAKSEGIRVEMVVVGEDVAIDTPGLAGRRGLAGTVLVHKVRQKPGDTGTGIPSCKCTDVSMR